MSELEAYTISAFTGSLLLITVVVLLLRSRLFASQGPQPGLQINKIPVRDAIISGLLILFFSLTPLTAFLSHLLHSGTPPTSGATETSANNPIVYNVVASSIILIAISLVLIHRRRQDQLVLNEFPVKAILSRDSRQQLGISLLTYLGIICYSLCIALAFNGLYVELGVMKALSQWFQAPELQSSVTQLCEGPLGVRLAIGISAVLIAPVAEELCFRGFIYPILKRGTNLWFAAIVTSLIFGLAHASIAHVIPLAVLSLILIWSYERSKTIAVPIAIHTVFNLLTVLYSFFGD